MALTTGFVEAMQYIYPGYRLKLGRSLEGAHVASCRISFVFQSPLLLLNVHIGWVFSNLKNRPNIKFAKFKRKSAILPAAGIWLVLFHP